MTPPDIATTATATARLVDGLRERTARVARAVAGRAPATPVPTCPAWPLRTLVGHLGQEHRWAAELVRSGQQLPPPDPHRADPGPPDEWAEWLEQGAEELIRAVRRVGAERESDTFAGPLPAAFWLRRMLADTCVHHYDAACATATAFEIADDLAAVVIGENLDLLTMPAFAAVRPAVAELRGRGEQIGFRPGSAEGWVVTRRPGGLRWERGPVEADVVASGSAADLMLLIARRITPQDGRVTVTGDRALLDHWLAHSAF
ncbi:maleylpyruvate isomerase family mycothiol-dependent enzyme [Streptomyces sp. BE303]|uniref:maleylpyruvate isomerase family mycothiol-dependent enzyme n=1 Tax=Streptomyces sp. BE303 TaxID=3002528 RepID=UPI002E76BBEB|nr:maleylpyruvate isomerase family mycothiol-dependent enzyme [Streptomyces sp. BE303]MED7947625.1 maleylpyruvate isomerase family mycothiol-dependent enzyme [Streptomyces sp. BE303]